MRQVESWEPIVSRAIVSVEDRIQRLDVSRPSPEHGDDAPEPVGWHVIGPKGGKTMILPAGRLNLEHRPDTGTALKNGAEGNRKVASPNPWRGVGRLHRRQRKETTDEYGRDPLLTTAYGRVAKSTVQNYVYAWTLPCAIKKEWPYREDPEDCQAARRNNWASQCPDSLSCHPVRKEYITEELRSGVPPEVVSKRCDVSKTVMEKHYDMGTEAKKMAARRVALELAKKSGPGYGE